MLQSPLVKSVKKEEILTSIFGSKINELTINIIQLLISQRRENLLPLFVKNLLLSTTR